MTRIRVVQQDQLPDGFQARYSCRLVWSSSRRDRVSGAVASIRSGTGSRSVSAGTARTTDGVREMGKGGRSHRNHARWSGLNTDELFTWLSPFLAILSMTGGTANGNRSCTITIARPIIGGPETRRG